jgi:hypothetical protein
MLHSYFCLNNKTVTSSKLTGNDSLPLRKPACNHRSTLRLRVHGQLLRLLEFDSHALFPGFANDTEGDHITDLIFVKFVPQVIV